MKTAVLIACIVGGLGFGTARAQDIEEFWLRPYDTLAQRDEYGLLHSSKQVKPTDMESRYHCRPFCYLGGGRDLVREPGYVGSLQESLRRLGYYCGPIDGVFTDEVAASIAHMQ